MTPEHLKKSIFTYAFSGMLVEQKDNEYVNEEGFKAVKDIPDDIDIPATWRWTYLPDIATICYGFPFNSEFFNETKQGRPLIRIRDIIGGKTSTYTTEDCPDEYVIKKGDMLVGMDGNFQVEYWGSEEALMNQRVCKIDANNDYLDQDYLYYYLPIILKEINGSVSFSTVKHLSAKILNVMLIPLPPIEEQHRIVTKIEELLPYVDHYAEVYEKLEQFNAKFPEDMKKSILQYAIRGKLVEQREEEGTAEELYQQIQEEKQKLIKEGKIKKEKHLAEITEDEIPFDIPDSWKWVRLSDVIDVRDGTHDTPGYIPEGYPLITGKDFYNGYFDFAKTKYISKEDYEEIIKRSKVDVGDILFSMIGGNIGSMIVITEENYIDMAIKNVALFKQYNYELSLTGYLEVFLRSQVPNMQAIAKGGAQSFVSLNMLRNYPFPLPPLEEQHRIVAKLEELLPYCDRLLSGDK